MIWFKLKHLKAKNATVYTTDKEIAAEFEMVSKKKGKFFYRIISAKHLRKALGITTRRYSQYMVMVHRYPPAAHYIVKREKIPLDVKAEMEAFMEWNTDTKTFNQDKVYE